MTDLDERFRSLARARVPDQWAEIVERPPGPLPPPRTGPRIAAATVALVVAASGLVIVATGLREGPAVSTAPSPSIAPSDRANGPIYFRVGGGEGGSRIEAVEPDGSSRRVVFDDEPTRIAQIAWSPDGSMIAYQNPILDERGIFVANADGSDPVRLTEGVNEGWPSWSPDGTTIVFSSSRDDPSVGPCTPGADFRCPTDIYAIGVDGSNLRRLTTDPSPEYEPVWSPDGRTIAFVRSVEGMTADESFVEAPRIFAMDPGGADVRQVSSGDGGSDFGPSWSQDGRRLAFVAIRNENWGVWTIDADGSDEHRIFGGSGCCFVFDAQWSPDGAWIAFAGRPEGEDYSPEDSLYVMRPDGTDVTLLAPAEDRSVAGDIAWRPVLFGSSLEPTTSPSPAMPSSAELVDTFRVGEDVRSVVYGDGSVWIAVSNADGSFRGTIVRLDPESHDVQAEIPVEVIPTWEVGGGAMVVADGSLWVTGGLERPGAYDAPGGGSDAAVIRIDTATNEVVQTIALGGSVGADLTFLDGELWVLLFGDERVDHAMEVVHVDTATGDDLRRLVLEASWAHTIVGAEGYIAVYEGGDEGVNVGGHLTSIHVATGTSASVENPSRYSEGGPVLWRGEIWIATETGFARLDPSSGELLVGADELDPSQFGFCCGFIEADDRGIWFIDSGEAGQHLHVFDPSTGAMSELITLDEGSPVAMAVAPSGVYILNYEGTLTHVAVR